MGKIFRLNRNFDNTIADRKEGERGDMINFWYAQRDNRQQQINIMKQNKIKMHIK